jgi:hypothetical protein
VPYEWSETRNVLWKTVYGHGLVFIATGFNEPSLVAVRVDGAGDITRMEAASLFYYR